MKMGDKIRECRKEAGYTQEELGKILKPAVNRAAVNKWECGYVENIKRTYIEQMAELFNVQPSELMCFDTKVEIPNPTKVLSEQKERLMAYYDGLRQEDKNQLVAFTKYFERLCQEDKNRLMAITKYFERLRQEDKNRLVAIAKLFTNKEQNINPNISE
ncbi:MAG: helix-turn-helix transcriptional regulator [Lachnospiraceae bacterium]|nr:helix-turn-helix transcriptional regulator [Lachnospiraceae bacterium]